mgnify:CR=1 FL=1
MNEYEKKSTGLLHATDELRQLIQGFLVPCRPFLRFLVQVGFYAPILCLERIGCSLVALFAVTAWR